MLLTLLNDTADAQDAAVEVDFKALGLNQPASARLLVSGKEASRLAGGWQVSLRPQQAEVLAIARTLE